MARFNRQGGPAGRRPRLSPRRLALGLGGAAALMGLGATGAFSQVAAVVTGSNSVSFESSSADQYQAGFAFGDPDYNNPGPPKLRLVDAAGKKAEVKLGRVGAGPYGSTVLAAPVLIDEQADLRIRVLSSDDRPLALLDTTKKPESGEPSLMRQIRYRVLVPRALTLKVAVAAGRIEQGESYRLLIRATDASRNRSNIAITFSPGG